MLLALDPLLEFRAVAASRDAASALRLDFTAGRVIGSRAGDLLGPDFTAAMQRRYTRVAARGIRRLTGYERVLIYQFDSDWNGQAIAEDRTPDWEQSLDGLNFCASDIPAQARELYRRSQIRCVADRDAIQVPIDAEPGWHSRRPLPAPSTCRSPGFAACRRYTCTSTATSA